jgi:hypothetical protein
MKANLFPGIVATLVVLSPINADEPGEPHRLQRSGLGGHG